VKPAASQVLAARDGEALLRVAGRGLTAHRNRALVALLWRCGLRCGEALALMPADIRFEARTVHVSSGKGGRARTVGLDTLTAGLLSRWLAVRRELLGARPRTPVLCTLTGRPLASRYVRQLLPRLAARAGIAGRVHPHLLRHTFAVELAREGQPMPLIQAALGHASLGTTSLYLRHFGALEVTAAMSSRVSLGGAETPAPAKGPRPPRPAGVPARRTTSTSTAKAPTGRGRKRARARRASARAPAAASARRR